MIRLSDLRRIKVGTTEGKSLGRVHEVHCDEGRIIALICGPGSFIERLTARTKGRRIPWERVRKLEDRTIIVTPDPPQRLAKKASASRSRQGTQQASARKPKR